MKREESDVGKTVMVMGVPGKNRDGRHKRRLKRGYIEFGVA